MKFKVGLFMLCVILFSSQLGLSQPIKTISIDASNDFDATNEFPSDDPDNDSGFGTNNEIRGIYLTWDLEYLYIGMDYTLEDEKSFILYIDTDEVRTGETNFMNGSGYTGAFQANVTTDTDIDVMIALFNPSGNGADGSLNLYRVNDNSTTTLTISSSNAGGAGSGNFNYFSEIRIEWTGANGIYTSSIPNNATIKIGAAGREKESGGFSRDIFDATGTHDFVTAGTQNFATASDFAAITVADANGNILSGRKTTDNTELGNTSTVASFSFTADGALGEWNHNSEFIGKGRNTSGSETDVHYYVTWDNSNVYAGFAGIGSPASDKFNLAIDVNPNVVDDDMSMFAGVTFAGATNPKFEPDYIYQFSNNVLTYYQSSGSGWDGGTASSGAKSFNGNIVEFSFPKTEIGSPGGSVGIYMWLANSSDQDYNILGFKGDGSNYHSSTPDNTSNSSPAIASELGWLGNVFCQTGIDVNDNIKQDAALPIDLVFFRAITNFNSIELQWQTNFEFQNDRFHIERKVENGDWKVIGEVFGRGNSYESLDYNFHDENPIEGGNYYRLKQIDFDGSYNYSKVVFVNYSELQEVLIYPNPLRNSMTIQFEKEIEHTLDIQILSVDGKIMRLVESEYYHRELQIDLTDLKVGMYFLKIQSDNGGVWNERFLKLE